MESDLAYELEGAGSGASFLNASNEAIEAVLVRLGWAPPGAASDTERLAWMYSGRKTGSMALVHLELRMLNGEPVTLEEARAAIDECMSTPLVPEERECCGR